MLQQNRHTTMLPVTIYICVKVDPCCFSQHQQRSAYQCDNAGLGSPYQDHVHLASPVPSPAPSQAASSTPSVPASPAASPAPSTSSGLKGLLGEACTSIIAQQQARRTPSFKKVAATRVLANHTSPQATPASVSHPPQHSTSQFVAAPLLQPSPHSSHALPAADQLSSGQAQQQQTHPHQQQQHLAVYSRNAAAPAPLTHPALESHAQSAHRALFAQGHNSWLDSPAWAGAASDATLACKHPGSALQDQQQQLLAASFSGQVGDGNESGDEQLNDHNMWSQFLNPQPEPEPQAAQPQAECQLQPEPQSITQHAVPPNNQALGLTEAAAPEQLTVSQAGPVLTQATLQSVVPDQQLPVGPHSSSHAIACNDGNAPAGKDKEHMLTGQHPMQLLQGRASTDLESAQHEASLQAQSGSDVSHVDFVTQSAAQGTQEPAQQEHQASDIASTRADNTDAQHQDSIETRSKGQLAELDRSGFSPQTRLHHDLPADCVMADAEHVSQSPSSRPMPSFLQNSRSEDLEASQGLSPLSGDDQRAERTPASELVQVRRAQQALHRSSGNLDEPHHAQQATDAQVEEAQHAQQACGVQSEKAQRAQQASDKEMDDAQHMPDIQTEEVEQPQQVSEPDTSQMQHAQQEHIVEMQGPQQTPDVDVTAAQHAQHATDSESPKPQQASDSALHEAQHAQQAPDDIEMRDAQQAAGPAQQDLQCGIADTAEDLPLQPRRSRRGKGPAQDSTDPQTGSATEVAPAAATKPAAEAAPSNDQEEAVVGPPATRSSAAKRAAGKTRSAKPAAKPAAKHDGASKAAGLPETHKIPGPSSQQQQQQPPAKDSHKKQPKRQRLTGPEDVGQQTVSKASAAGAGKRVQAAVQECNAAGDVAGETQLVPQHTHRRPPYTFTSPRQVAKYHSIYIFIYIAMVISQSFAVQSSQAAQWPATVCLLLAYLSAGTHFRKPMRPCYNTCLHILFYCILFRWTRVRRVLFSKPFNL